MKATRNRAFTVRVKLTGRFNKKVDSITISDGLNDLTLNEFDYFTINSDEPIDRPIIFYRG